jgi:hypothetical protein
MLFPGILFLVCALPVTLPADSPPELRELVRKSLVELLRDDRNMSDYLFERRTHQREFDSAGKLKSQTSVVVQREERDGVAFGHVLERNGQPVSGDERAKDEGRIRKRIAEAKSVDANDRENKKEDYSWVREIPEAMEYKLAGQEQLNGREAYVLECFPRPGYQARNIRTRVFEKTRGKMWIDKADGQLVKGDMEVFDTVSVGWGILGRIDKGTRFLLTRQKFHGVVWLPARQEMHLDVRVMMMKDLRRHVVTEYAGYKRRPSRMTAPATGAQP